MPEKIIKRSTSQLALQNDNAFTSSTQKIDSFLSNTEDSFLLKESDVVIEEKTLGKGTSATVYLAQSKDKQVAVKQIDLIKFPYERCAKEVSILAQFTHSQYIIHLCGYFKDNTHFNLVTEYMPKGSLHNLISDEKLPSWKAGRQQIWNDMCKGVDELHKIDVIHRDLKSANILLSEDENGIHAKIADFGSAMYSTELEPSLAGSLRWMAPEVASNREYSKKSDMFALGKICVELIKQETPPASYSSESDSESDNDKEDFSNLNQSGEDYLPLNCPQKIFRQMKLCLLFNPKARPTASMLVKENDNHIDSVSSISKISNSN